MRIINRAELWLRSRISRSQCYILRLYALREVAYWNCLAITNRDFTFEMYLRTYNFTYKNIIYYYKVYYNINSYVF